MAHTTTQRTAGQLGPHAFAYVECDIPVGMTVREYHVSRYDGRRRRRPLALVRKAWLS